MSTTTTPKPEPRTVEGARREFACVADATRLKRRIHQTERPQGMLLGQSLLTDCVAESTPPARSGMRLGPSRRETANAGLVDLPDDDSPLHCQRCGRKFTPDGLDSLTGLCWACFEKTAVQLHR